MTPEQIAASGTEHAEQSALFCWAALPEQQRDYPQLRFMYAIANGGSRGDSVLSRKIRGASLKAEGVKSGAPDVCVPFPYGYYAGLYIEMKRRNGKPSDVSKDQELFIEHLNKVGYKCVVCFGWVQAVMEIVRYFSQVAVWPKV